MSEGLILVLVVAASYLAARVAFEWLARRYLIVSGAEYLLLGILLGPQVSRILSPKRSRASRRSSASASGGWAR